MTLTRGILYEDETRGTAVHPRLDYQREGETFHNPSSSDDFPTYNKECIEGIEKNQARNAIIGLTVFGLFYSVVKIVLYPIGLDVVALAIMFCVNMTIKSEPVIMSHEECMMGNSAPRSWHVEL